MNPESTSNNLTTEALYVEDMLNYLKLSKHLLKLFHQLDCLGKTKVEIVELFTENQIPYRLHYSENSYYSNKTPPCVAKILISNNRCIAAGMNN